MIAIDSCNRRRGGHADIGRFGLGSLVPGWYYNKTLNPSCSSSFFCRALAFLWVFQSILPGIHWALLGQMTSPFSSFFVRLFCSMMLKRCLKCIYLLSWATLNHFESTFWSILILSISNPIWPKFGSFPLCKMAPPVPCSFVASPCWSLHTTVPDRAILSHKGYQSLIVGKMHTVMTATIWSSLPQPFEKSLAISVNPGLGNDGTLKSFAHLRNPEMTRRMCSIFRMSEKMQHTTVWHTQQPRVHWLDGQRVKPIPWDHAISTKRTVEEFWRCSNSYGFQLQASKLWQHRFKYLGMPWGCKPDEKKHSSQCTLIIVNRTRSESLRSKSFATLSACRDVLACLPGKFRFLLEAFNGYWIQQWNGICTYRTASVFYISMLSSTILHSI